MNIGFPKTENSISALTKINIALFVTSYIYLLDFMKIVGIDSWISMPKVTIPLNDYICNWDKNINNKLTTNNLLFFIFNPIIIKYPFTRIFKAVIFWMVWKSKYTIDALHICFVIATSHRAILSSDSIQSPTRNIKRYITGFANQNLAASPDADCFSPRFIFSLWGFLPCVSTFQRAKSNISSAARNKVITTVITGICTAIITPLRKVGSWNKLFTTL